MSSSPAAQLPRARITDHEGDVFPAGTILDLCFAKPEPQAPTSENATPSSEALWLFHYHNDDRTRVALQQYGEAFYLATEGGRADCEVSMSDDPHWWNVHPGAYPRSFVLSNDLDLFLQAWEGAEDQTAIEVALCKSPYVESISNAQSQVGGSGRTWKATSWSLKPCKRFSGWKANASKDLEPPSSTPSSKIPIAGGQDAQDCDPTAGGPASNGAPSGGFGTTMSSNSTDKPSPLTSNGSAHASGQTNPSTSEQERKPSTNTISQEGRPTIAPTGSQNHDPTTANTGSQGHKPTTPDSGTNGAASSATNTSPPDQASSTPGTSSQDREPTTPTTSSQGKEPITPNTASQIGDSVMSGASTATSTPATSPASTLDQRSPQEQGSKAGKDNSESGNTSASGSSAEHAQSNPSKGSEHDSRTPSTSSSLPMPKGSRIAPPQIKRPSRLLPSQTSPWSPDLLAKFEAGKNIVLPLSDSLPPIERPPVVRPPEIVPPQASPIKASFLSPDLLQSFEESLSKQ